jgi:tRNA (cytidine32/uridine32-2'-O)-methyltransferase
MEQNIRIVLVNTSHPGNIGSSARALKTMGLSKLYLVAPEQFPHAKATAMAAGADDVLANATVVPSLPEALADCQLVIGTSARERRLSWPLIYPRECAHKVVEQAAGQGEVALVFGQERAGLDNSALEQCHYHVTIPSSEEYSALNLAASVQVLCYEIRLAILAQASKAQAPSRGDPKATQAEVEQLYQHLFSTIENIGFFDPKNPGKVQSRLRRLFARAHLEKLEVNILRGILNAVDDKSR